MAALDIVRDEPERRTRLHALVARLVAGARELGYEVLPTDSAVVGVLIGEAADALAVGASLRADRVWAPAIRPPSVPVGTARMRLTVMATHEDRHIDWALDALAAARPLARPRRALMLDERGIFVMGTGTGVGKTVVTASIALAARARGRTVAPLKPAQTGDDGNMVGDAEFVATLIGLDEPADALCPYRLRAPLAPAVAARIEGVRLDPGVVVAAYEELTARHDLVLVEAAGGALVPFSDGVDMAALASRLGLPVVVVTPPGLGMLNHTLLTLEALHRRGLTVLGVVISGYPEDARPRRPHQPLDPRAAHTRPAARRDPPRRRDRHRGRTAGPPGRDRPGRPRSPARRHVLARPLPPCGRGAPRRPHPRHRITGDAMDPTDAAHVMQTPEEYADFLSGMSFDKRIEMINSFRCAELQGAEELRVLSETTDDPDLAKKFARHAADEEKHGAYFGEIMQRLGVEPFDPPDEPDHITIGGRLIVDTLNDIEEILPQRGETVGLDRVIPILTLFQAVESRALISFEAHRRTFENADPVIAERIGEIIADESHHARYVRQLLDEWAADGWGDEVREAQEATEAREAKAREWAAERLEAERLREEGRV